MTGISLSRIPKGSKLILIGDWYKRSGNGWHIACYFFGEDGHHFRRGFPVDLLPALIPGTIYPGTSTENKAERNSGVFKVSSIAEWETFRYNELPCSLRRLRKYSTEIADQVVYRMEAKDRIYWLPAIELARMLFFHSSEVVRAAVYHGNTWQLAKADQKDWTGTVAFSSNVPVSYLRNLQFRKFFAWLLFDEGAEESFCSIFMRLNESSYLHNSVNRWTFDFQPPDLAATEISWAGYIGSHTAGERHHCYIREIRAISGVPAPELDAVVFSHPDDVFYIENEPDDSESGSHAKTRKQKSRIVPKEIDPHNAPKAGKKRHLIQTHGTGFHFDAEIDLRRRPLKVKGLPKAAMPDLQGIQEENTLGITEGSDHGSKPRADIDNLEKPELIDAPEKLAFFQTMLEQLKAEHGWDINTDTGDVPKNHCRSAHLVGGRPRKYSHAVVTWDDTNEVHILEIELAAKETLSTLLFRASHPQQAVEKILDALMTNDTSQKYKAMQWKRKNNAEYTIARHYLEHPDNKIKSEEEALESWVARAADKILSL